MKYLMFRTLAVVLSGFIITSPARNSSTYLGKAPDKVVEITENVVDDSEETNDNLKIETKKPVKSTKKTNQKYTKTKETEKISLGTFKLTAYCSCERCCGSYAKNRPVDENGNQIVYGSSGEVLKEGVSIAVDTKVIPYNTKVIIDGNEYIAHDTGGAIKENKIDVYFEDHQRARDFGVQHKEVFVYE